MVMRGWHHAASTEYLKEEIERLGFEVRRVTNVISRKDKVPLPLFFVDLEPNSNNKNIYAIKAVGNGVVTFEAPRKNNDLVQCHRCQMFGHTKAYCRRVPSCVKCGQDHFSTECKKAANTPAKCVHCQEKHPANYRGCSVYQQLVNRRNVTINRNIRPEPTPINNPAFTTRSVSYAQYANNANPTPFVPESNPMIETIFTVVNEIKTMFIEFTNMFKSLFMSMVPQADSKR